MARLSKPAMQPVLIIPSTVKNAVDLSADTTLDSEQQCAASVTPRPKKLPVTPHTKVLDAFKAEDDKDNITDTPLMSPAPLKKPTKTKRSGSFNAGDYDVTLPPPFPKTPAGKPSPSKQSGEQVLTQWLEESGLADIHEQLHSTLMQAGHTSLSKLAALSDADLLAALKPLKLKSLKLRKIQAAVVALRNERDAFAKRRSWRVGRDHSQASPQAPMIDLTDAPAWAPREQCTGAETAASAEETQTVSTSTEEDEGTGAIAPPLDPKRPSQARFKPRTRGGLVDRVPASPESAAHALGLTGPSEARELGELATLLAGGGKPSARASKWEANINAGVLASAAAREAAEAKAAAEEAKAKEAVKVKAQDERGEEEVSTQTPRSKKQIEELRLIDLQGALEEAASARAVAGLEESPMRTMMLEATAPRGEALEFKAEEVYDKPRRKVPRAKRPPQPKNKLPSTRPLANDGPPSPRL